LKQLLSPTIITQNTRPICPLVALQVKCSIPIFSLLKQQDLKDNTLCKWVSRREDTQIWVMSLLIPKMGLMYGYSVEAIGIVLETHFRFGSQTSLLFETALGMV
jgi:hypothetical protein